MLPSDLVEKEHIRFPPPTRERVRTIASRLGISQQTLYRTLVLTPIGLADPVTRETYRMAQEVARAEYGAEVAA